MAELVYKKGANVQGEDRFSHVAVWNTVMPTYEYSLQKWYEFITS